MKCSSTGFKALNICFRFCRLTYPDDWMDGAYQLMLKASQLAVIFVILVWVKAKYTEQPTLYSNLQYNRMLSKESELNQTEKGHVLNVFSET